jgi:hypothetical protein
VNPSSETSFRSEVERFLLSVAQRDFKTFTRFFSPDLDFRAELPGGVILEDVDSFMKSQAAWFRGNEGAFQFQVETASVSGLLGYATVTVRYSNFDEARVPFTLKILLSLRFMYHEQAWVLVYDHNQVLERE